MPISTIAPIAIALALPPPNRNVVIVAALVAHAGPDVRHDRARDHQQPERLPQALEAGHRRLAGRERVALDLHVDEELRQQADDRRPQEHETDLGGDVGEEDVLAGRDADADEDDARARRCGAAAAPAGARAPRPGRCSPRGSGCSWRFGGSHGHVASRTSGADTAVRDNVHSYGSGRRAAPGHRAAGEGAAGGDGPLAARPRRALRRLGADALAGRARRDEPDAAGRGAHRRRASSCGCRSCCGSTRAAR